MTAKVLIRGALGTLVVAMGLFAAESTKAQKLKEPGGVPSAPRLDTSPSVPRPVAKPNLRIENLWVHPDIYRDNDKPDIMTGWVNASGHKLCYKVVNDGPGASPVVTVGDPLNPGRGPNNGKPQQVRALAPNASTTQCNEIKPLPHGKPEYSERWVTIKVDVDKKVAEVNEHDNTKNLVIQIWARPDLQRLCHGGNIERYRPSSWSESAPFIPLYRCTFRDRSYWDCDENSGLRCSFHELRPAAPLVTNPG